jgi:uncharacterized membrane protein
VIVLPVLLATGWVLLLIAAPLFPGWAGAALYGIGSLVCHQIPERSFYIAGFQLPVCARCIGIYAGVAAGAARYLWIRGRSERSVRAMAPRTARWLAVVAAAPTLTTVALEMTGVWQPSNSTRAIAGALLGFLIALVVMNALATLHYDECVPPRPTVPKPPQRSI